MFHPHIHAAGTENGKDKSVYIHIRNTLRGSPFVSFEVVTAHHFLLPSQRAPVRNMPTTITAERHTCNLILSGLAREVSTLL